METYWYDVRFCVVMCMRQKPRESVHVHETETSESVRVHETETA
jgi:hypothetical protein